MSDAMLPSGTNANVTGNRLEQFVQNILEGLGYIFIDKTKFKPAIYLEQSLYTRHYHLGKSIYKTDSYCDFILYHPKKHPNCLIIETKWQQSVGSVDEKYPYLVKNIQEKYPHKTVVILDGNGYKTGAEEWLRDQVGNNLLAVYSMVEFQKWVNKGGI